MSCAIELQQRCTRSMPMATSRGPGPASRRVSSCSATFSIRSWFRGIMRISHGRVSTAHGRRLASRLRSRRLRRRLSRTRSTARPDYPQLIVVASDCDERAAAGVVYHLHVAHLTVDVQAALLGVDRGEMSLTVPAQQQSTTRIVAAEHWADVEKVSGNDEIGFAIAVEVARHGSIDRRELSFTRQRRERKGSVAVVESDSALEGVGFTHLRLSEIRRRQNVFDSAGAERLVSRVFATQRRNLFD